MPLLVQCHHRDAGDRLRHGADLEEVVLFHHITGLQVPHAPCVHISELAVSQHHADGARDTALVHVALEDLSYSL